MLSEENLALAWRVASEFGYDEATIERALGSRAASHVGAPATAPIKAVHVYVIAEADGGASKVGVSESPYGRLAALQACNPRELSVAYLSRPFERARAMEIERNAHAYLANHRIRGEWFDCCSALAEEAVYLAGGTPE